MSKEAEGAERAPARRGPRPKLTVAAIVGVGIELADADGLNALSMRRVAERLGVGQASLYTYVSNKNELLDVMLDTVVGEPTVPTGATWRERLEWVARRDWALYTKHPWVLQIAGHRPVTGPNTLAAYGVELDLVSELELTPEERVSVIDLIDTYVRGVARNKVDAEQAERLTGITDDQWWKHQAPSWARHVDLDRYPALADPTLAAAIFGRHDEKFELGLRLFIDGLEVYLTRPKGPPDVA